MWSSHYYKLVPTLDLNTDLVLTICLQSLSVASGVLPVNHTARSTELESCKAWVWPHQRKTFHPYRDYS